MRFDFIVDIENSFNQDDLNLDIESKKYLDKFYKNKKLVNHVKILRENSIIKANVHYIINLNILRLDLKEINPNIKLYILGDGPDFNILKNKAEELELLNKTVYLKGFLPYEEVVSYLKSSDIALNAIKGKALQTMTNKFGDFVSAGLPILNCCQMEEVKKIIEEKGLGMNYIPENSNSLKEAILFLLEHKDKMLEFSKNSKKFANEKFDRRKSYNIIFEKIKEILQ